MSTFLAEARQTLVPRGEVKHGPLPPLLVAMTLVTGSKAGRRLIAVLAMFLGALVGSLLIFHVSIVYPLVLALIVVALIAGMTQLLSRTDAARVRAS